MKVDVFEVQLEFDGFVKVERAVLRFEQFDGRMSEVVIRRRFFRGDAVAVLIYDPSARQVLLQRQFRYTVYARTGDGWHTECVAGMAEEKETPFEAARREVLEETGLKLKHAELIAHYFIGPGGSSDQVYLYLGYIENSDHPTGTHGLIEEGEDIASAWISLEEALKLVDERRINDAKTIMALTILDRRLRTTESSQNELNL